MSFLATVPARVAGIPCRVGVEYFTRQKPLGPSADSDWDCYGYTQADYVILDQRGRPAPWLEAKATKDDHERIEELIHNYFTEGED